MYGAKWCGICQFNYFPWKGKHTHIPAKKRDYFTITRVDGAGTGIRLSWKGKKKTFISGSLPQQILSGMRGEVWPDCWEYSVCRLLMENSFPKAEVQANEG